MTHAARAAGALALTFALVACPGDGGNRGNRASPKPKPVRGGILSVALGEDVDFLDPHRAGQPSALALMRAMHRGLMAFPAEEFPKGVDPVPDLAEPQHLVSADARTYTFRIREGVAFGPPASRPVTANDVRAGIMRLLSLDSPYAPYFRVITSVIAPDEHTVVIALSRPVNDLLWILAHPAAAAIPADLELQRVLAPAAISASGPYRLSPTDGYRPERSIRLVRNPAWRQETDPVRGAYVDEIVVRIGGTPADIARSIDRQAADISLDTPPPMPPLTATASPSPSPSPGATASPSPPRDPRLHTTPAGCLRYLWMNTTVTPFDDVRVRRAVAAAIDRAPILDAAGGAGAGIATASPLVRTLRGAPGEITAPSPQPSAAAPVFRSLRLARGFSSTLVVGNRPVDVVQARAVVAALRAAGSFPIRITTMPIASVYVDAYEVPGRKTPMGIATWCADWPGMGGRAHLTPLLHSRSITRASNQNYAMLRDTLLDRLLDAAVVAPAGEAGAAWSTAADRVSSDAAWVPLLDLNEVSQVGSRVGGFVATPMFPRGDLTAIWLEAGAPPPATAS